MDVSPIVAWRRPAKRGPTTPLVVLVHGLGADEHDLLEAVPLLPRAFAYASLRAPLPYEAEGGYRWFTDRGPGRPIAASLRDTVAYVRAWADGPATAGYAPERTYLLGFSQGMMLAGALLLADPARFGGAVLLSGALAVEGAVPDRLRGVPVFYGSGDADTALPAELVGATRRYLTERSGAELTARTYSRGHSIARAELDDIAAWLTARG